MQRYRKKTKFDNFFEKTLDKYGGMWYTIQVVMSKTQNSLKEVQKKFFWEIWKKDLTNTKKCDIINKSLNNRWQNEILGCRQVVRQRTLTPLFRGFKSFHPNQMKTRCNASGFLFFKYRTGMLILVHVKLEYEKEKAYPQMECSADTLFD